MKKILGLALLLLGSTNNIDLHGAEDEIAARNEFIPVFERADIHAAVLEGGIGVLGHYCIVNAVVNLSKNDDRAKKFFGVGATLIGLHAYYVSRMRKMRAGDISMHRVNNVGLLNNNLRKIEGDCLCYNYSPAYIKNEVVMQTQCCGHLLCKEDVLSFIKNWRARPHASDETVNCFWCQAHPWFVREVRQDETVKCVWCRAHPWSVREVGQDNAPIMRIGPK